MTDDESSDAETASFKDDCDGMDPGRTIVLSTLPSIGQLLLIQRVVFSIRYTLYSRLWVAL
jgi:hypothetical protein